MHVADHGRVHLHKDGTRHVHKSAQHDGGKHVHKDGTTHDHKTGEHRHKDGSIHQHKVKGQDDKKSKMCLDKMDCCPTEGMKKAACCPSCGNAACTCCKTDKPVDEKRPSKMPAKLPVENSPAETETQPTEGAGTDMSVQTLGLPLLTWLRKFL